MENQRTIKVSDFVYAVRKYRNPLVLLVAAAFFCGVGLMFLSRYRADAKKLSKITASFAVTAENSQGGYSANRTEPQSQDIYLAENLADAVMYVCTSDALAATVRSNLGLPDAIVQEVRSNLPWCLFYIVNFQISIVSSEESVRTGKVGTAAWSERLPMNL